MLGLTGKVLYASEVFGRSHKFISLSEFSNLLFGATVFLLTRSMLQNRNFSIADLLHYIPAGIYITLICTFYIFPSQESIRLRAEDGRLVRDIYLFIGFALVFNIGYWIASMRMVFNFRKRQVNFSSFVIKTQFLRNFLIAIGICLLTWLAMYITSIFGNQMAERNARPFIWISIAMIILFLASYMMIEPKVFEIEAEQKKKKYAHSKLNSNDLEDLKRRLEQFMEEKKPYLNQKLLKAELAEAIGVSSPEMARLLNEKIGMNFFEFVNYYRIKEFIALAKTDLAQNLTLFGLAQEAGFNSKTTFNKSFKKLMGTSPGKYFNNLG